MTDDAGFFRNLSGLATDWVRQKRKALQTDPETNVDSMGGGHSYTFAGQDVTFEDLRDIKDIRDSGGQVAQLMSYKALLNFGEGAELHVETDGEDDELPTRPVDGTPMTVKEWLEQQFPHLDLLVLELGEDALWYPAAYGEIRENRAGEFKDALPAEPWTILPETDDKGEILAYVQQTQGDGGRVKQRLDPDDIWSIILNRQSARDKTGISEVLRNREEIQAFKENEQAINQAIELHGFPQRHVKVGKEDGAPVRDDDLRRVRTIFDPRTTDANTAYFTGQDVDVETLEAHQFDYTAIHEMDMRNLTTALGLPLEAGNVGSDGLGSGKPAELRFALLKLSIKANQRAFGVQFVEHILKPVIRDYSPFECPDTLTLEINDPLEDVGEVADLINSVGDYMTNAEARRKLDLSEPADDDVADAYRSPADIERAEEGDGGEQGGLDQIFGGDGRELAEIPDKYVTDTGLSEDDFVPNADVEDVVDDVLAFIDEEGLPNPENQREGAARANQLKDHAADGEPLAVEFWEEISNFHARHRAQGNHECDESDLPEAAAESDFDECYFDPGYFSDKTWGGDPGKEQADRIVEAIESTDGVELSGDTDFRCMGGVSDDELAHAPEWDRPLLEMYRGVTDPDTDPSRTLVSFASSGTPEFVLERIREAIDDGAMFAQIDSIPSDRMMDLRTRFKESLGTDDFTLDSITDALMEFEADLGRDEAERIARTESSAVLNRAREIGYEERGEADELFYWTGAEPGDNRQTEACEWLIRQTNPFHGGDPVPLEELRDMLTDAAEQDPDIPKSMVRKDSWTIHINERSTFAKAPEVEV